MTTFCPETGPFDEMRRASGLVAGLVGLYLWFLVSRGVSIEALGHDSVGSRFGLEVADRAQESALYFAQRRVVSGVAVVFQQI